MGKVRPEHQAFSFFEDGQYFFMLVILMMADMGSELRVRPSQNKSSYTTTYKSLYLKCNFFKISVIFVELTFPSQMFCVVIYFCRMSKVAVYNCVFFTDIVKKTQLYTQLIITMCYYYPHVFQYVMAAVCSYTYLPYFLIFFYCRTKLFQKCKH